MTHRSNPLDAHPDLDRLADLDEGLLEADDAAGVRQHLASCAACRAELAALVGLRADLAARPAAAGDAEEMPADVATRVDAALATEAGNSRRTSSVTVVPLLERRRARWRTGVLQAAAVLVVVLALGGVAYNLAAGGGNSGASTASGAGSAADQGSGGNAAGAGPPTVVRSGRDYTSSTLGTAVGALTTVPVPASAGSPGLKAETASPGAGRSPQSEGSPGGLSTSPSPPGGTDGAAPLASPDKLNACLAGLDVQGPAIGVDLATFQGKPAAVIVVPTKDDPTHLDVYAVAPTCPAGVFLSFARVTSP